MKQERVFGEAVAELYGPNRDPTYLRTDFDRYRRTHLDRDQPEWLGDDAETAQLIEIYERKLRERGTIDFDDMMLLGLRLIEGNKWVRSCLQARFPIIAVDEYQDLGLALHRMVLRLVYDAGIRLFAVRCRPIDLRFRRGDATPAPGIVRNGWHGDGSPAL